MTITFLLDLRNGPMDPGRLGSLAGIGRKHAILLLALSASVLPGCARTISSAGAIGLGKAAAVVDEQSQAAFLEGNRHVRRVAVDRFVRSGDIALSEDKFPVVVTPESAAAWSQVLSDIERYGALVGSLTDPKRGAATADAFGALASELNNGIVGARISPGVGSAVATLASAFVDARAQRDARRIVTGVDPAFQATIRAMADAIGADDSSGLRGTVRASWIAALDETRRPYIDAASARNDPQQRRIVADFLSAIDRRDAQLRTLGDLRASLLALGTAHAALADGQARSVDALLDTIAARAAQTRRIYDSLDDRPGK